MCDFQSITGSSYIISQSYELKISMMTSSNDLTHPTTVSQVFIDGAEGAGGGGQA